MKKRFLKLLPAVAAMAVISTSVFADPVSDLAATLKQKYPATQFTSVEKSLVEGVFEVTMGRSIAYTDSTGRYFIFGHVFDMTTQQDMTANKLQSLNKVDWAGLNLSNAIKIKKGDGSREFAVFSDPDCPYCKKLETELGNLDNYTMYLFLFPIAQLHPGAPDKAKLIWCATDREKAWKDAVMSGKTPAKKECANPVEENIKIAGNMGIHGTPTLIRKDGVMMPGAAPAAQIETWLNSGK